MPYGYRRKIKRRSSFRGRRRVFRRRSFKTSRRFRRKNRISSQFAKQGQFVADRAYAKLVYRDRISFTGLTTTVGLQLYAGNSLYDPDFTGSGHQPYGFDQYAQLYANYTVKGSKISVSVWPTNGTNYLSSTIKFVLIPATAAAAVDTDMTYVGERPLAKSRVGSIFTRPANLSAYCNTGKVFGYTPKDVEYDKNFWAAIGNSPATLWYWHLYVQALDQSTSTSMQIDVKLTYYAKFAQRALPQESTI